jgi:hypothetical protein
VRPRTGGLCARRPAYGRAVVWRGAYGFTCFVGFCVCTVRPAVQVRRAARRRIEGTSRVPDASRRPNLNVNRVTVASRTPIWMTLLLDLATAAVESAFKMSEVIAALDWLKIPTSRHDRIKVELRQAWLDLGGRSSAFTRPASERKPGA